jgi:hypothetical protein
MISLRPDRESSRLMRDLGNRKARGTGLRIGAEDRYRQRG